MHVLSSTVFLICSLFTLGWGASNLPILINTLPKSGSVFLIDACQKNLSHLNYRFTYISQNRFYDDYVDEKKLENLSGFLFFSQEHIDASENNIAILKRHFPKIILHLRDPRQAFLSWYHHVETVKTNHYGLWSKDICPPQEYFTWPMSEKIDWQIEHYLPACVRWISKWCDVIDKGEMEILVTRYEDMIMDPNLFLECIFSFYNLKLLNKIIHAPFQEGALHQRKGLSDEWRQVLNPQQKKRIHEIIPFELLKRFGWEQ